MAPSFVMPRILERFAERVADRIDDRIDDLFDERRDQLDAAASLQGITRAQLIAELREHLYLQMDDADIESNDLNLVGFAGLWHPLVGSDAENIDCAASAAAFMFPATAPLKMFRRYERALAHEQLAPWNEAYRTHRKELARIAITDASLTGTVVRLAADLLPMLGEKSKATLSADAVQRLTKILAITRAQASPKLAPFLDRASEVFTAGEGKVFGELLKIAAQRAPK